MTHQHDEPSAEELSAWLDGELDRAGAQDMAQRVAADEKLAARVRDARNLDDLLRQAIPEEPVPDALLERLGLLDRPASAEVVDMAAAREARARKAAGQPAPLGRPKLVGPKWARIAAQVAVVASIGLAVAVWQGPLLPTQADAPYRTLSNAGRTAPANGVIVFAAGTDARTAADIARSSGALLVGEPNAAGAWKLSMPAGQRSAILESLRHDGRVSLAEPIDGEEP